MHKVFSFSTSFPTLVIFRDLFVCLFVLDNRHFTVYEMVSHCGLNLHFLMPSDVEHLCMFLTICLSYLQNGLFKSPAHFFKYIVDIQ